MRGSGGSCFEGEGLAVRDLDVDPETPSQPAMCRGILCGTSWGLIPAASSLCTSQQNTQC